MIRFDRRNAGRRGFTLIELLIVIAIILILIAIALPNFLAARTRAVVTQVQGELRTLATAIESYASDHHLKYPHLACERPGHQNNRNGVHFMCNLTTPVPYVTSDVIKRGDPFQGTHDQNPVRAITDASQNDTFATYAYINIGLYREDSNRPPRGGGPHFAVLSLGPDYRKGPHPITGNNWTYSRYGRDGPAPFFDDRYLAWNYSATNGTRSGGDILRFN